MGALVAGDHRTLATPGLLRPSEGGDDLIRLLAAPNYGRGVPGPFFGPGAGRLAPAESASSSS